MQARQSGTRTIPPIKTEEQWDALVKSVASEGGAIVESRSGEKVAVISYEEFLGVPEQRRKQQRAEMLERLREMEERQSRRNADLSDEEIEELAEQASREAFDELVAEGKLIFERDEKGSPRTAAACLRRPGMQNAADTSDFPPAP